MKLNKKQIDNKKKFPFIVVSYVFKNELHILDMTIKYVFH